MKKVLLLLLTLACCSTLFATVASALVRFDFEQMYFFDKDHKIKDHSIIKIGPLYHLYYIKAPLLPASPLAEDSLGHAVSADLMHWTILQPVISVAPGTWEDEAVWAPHVMAGPDGKYYMFYTGVNSHVAQAVGLATSTDGFTWTKSLQNPIYRPDTTWARWNESTSSDCRDPFVFLENGLYYMLTTTMDKPGHSTIACATSPDLLTWTDKGPIYTHEEPQSANPLESPFMIRRDGKYYLFINEWQVDGTTVISSDSLFSGWTLANRILVDRGVGAEIIDASGTELFSRYIPFEVNGDYWYTVKIDTLGWEGGSPFVRLKKPLKDDWIEVSGDAFQYQPTFGDNSHLRTGVTSGLQGIFWIGTYERFPGPLQFSGGRSGLSQGDNPVGEIRSRSFALEGSAIDLLVGGGDKPDSVFIALCDACTDRIIFSETGRNSETMDARRWDIGWMRGRQVYIRIVDRSSSPFGHISVDDIVESGVGFVPSDQPVVSLIRPNGGEVLDEGSRLAVSWTISGPPANARGSVSIYLSLDGGTTCTPVATGIKTASPYYLTVPSAPSDHCRIRVTYSLGALGSCDMSDADFVIADRTPPSVTVLTPSGHANTVDSGYEDDLIVGGKAGTISWTTVENGVVDSTNIYLSTDAGRTFPHVIVTGYRYQSPLVWHIPELYSDSCIIRIEAYDHGGNMGFGESAIFSILRLVGVGESGTGVPGLHLSLSSSPNPFHRRTDISYALPRGGMVRVDVFSVDGNLARMLVAGTAEAGTHSITWDGLDDGGVPVPSGVYLIRLSAGKTALTRKAVLLR